MGGATLLLIIATFRPSFAAELARGRRGWWIDITSDLTVGDVNIPLALLVLYLIWELFRFGWRWADETAVSATPHGLVPHRSTLMKSVPWIDIRDVRFVHLRRAPSLIIVLRSGRSRSIRGVDNEEGAAERFAALARKRAAAAGRDGTGRT